MWLVTVLSEIRLWEGRPWLSKSSRRGSCSIPQGWAPSLLYLKLLYRWNEAEDCHQTRTFSLSSTVPLAILVLTEVWLMPVHCIQAPLINRMHSQSSGSNVRTMFVILIATATHTANAGGRNGANECDCNTQFPYCKCQYLLNVIAGTCVCVCVCDFTFSHFEHLTRTFLYRRAFFLPVYSFTRGKKNVSIRNTICLLKASYSVVSDTPWYHCVCWKVQMTTFRFMQFFSVVCCFLSLRPTCSPQHLVLERT
jgi:hypothetical protein